MPLLLNSVVRQYRKKERTGSLSLCSICDEVVFMKEGLKQRKAPPLSETVRAGKTARDQTRKLLHFEQVRDFQNEAIDTLLVRSIQRLAEARV